MRLLSSAASGAISEGKSPFKAARLAFADARQGFADAAQRLQSDQHLDENAADQARAQQRETPDQRAVEEMHFGIDFRHVAGDEKDIGARVVGRRRCRDGKFEPLGHEAHALLIGPLRIARNGFRAARTQILWPDRVVEQGARDLRVAGVLRVDRNDLPIPSGIDALEARIGESAAERDFALRIGFGRGDHAVEIDCQPLVEIALDGTAEIVGQQKAADGEARDGPHRRRQDQPSGERTTPFYDQARDRRPEALSGVSRQYPRPRTV